MEQTTGGGVRRHISNEKLDEMRRDLDSIEREMRELTSVFLRDDSIKHRLRNVGKLSKEGAYHLEVAGPAARGSGVEVDLRRPVITKKLR
jgi:ech hydrogenase subunit E